jgi:hypothetical protein
VTELVVPLSELGLEGKVGERIDFSIARCDSPKGWPASCSSWPAPQAGRGRIVLAEAAR